ncbi:unnamed protein product, partial [Mesorhabditis spiculigera]
MSDDDDEDMAPVRSASSRWSRRGAIAGSPDATMAHYFDENIGERKPLYGLYAQRQRSIAETPNYMSMGPANAPPAQVEDEEDGINCSPCCDDDNVRRALRAIWLGQVLSLCLCGTGVSSQLLSNAGINAPAAQNLTNYFLLACVYGTALVWRGDRDDGFIAVLKTRGWKYFILALIDVEANYMIVYAYKYTTVTSVQLLDCMTIPTVLLLSWLFLSVRYLLSHIIGVCICLLGIACLIYADILQEKGSIGGSDRPLGDLLCISGSVLYAVSNVSEEFLVKQHSRIEYLAMVGTFGTFIAAIQSAILEHNTLASISWTWPHIGSFALYALCMFIFYSMFTVVLQRTSALMINLATLTADFYSLLFALFLFKDSFHFLYFVSFVVTLSGSLLYTLRPTEVRDADEPRRVCPCFFACCYCCDCCFETTDGSTRGSFNISPSPLPSSSAPSNTFALYMGHTDTRFCPVHGSRAAAHAHSTPIMPARNGRLAETRT